MLDGGFDPDMTAHPDRGVARNFVQFGMHPVRDDAESLKQGRPIFKDREFVRIVVPGDKTSSIHTPVTDRERRQYAQQYQAWKAGQDQDAASGTLLSMVPFITRAQAEELAYFKCRTAEQLAAMPDSAAQNFPGIQKLKQAAKDYLTAAAGNAPLEKMRSELAERDTKIAVLEQAIKEMGDRIDRQGKKRRGSEDEG